MVMIGYARVSTQEQHLDLQRDALMKAGCERRFIFEDIGISAVARKRPAFERALSALKPGDVFVVWKMDRAFRSLKNALDVLEQFEAQGIGLHCLTEPVDTTTVMGKCMYQVRNVFAELERNFIRERTVAGMEAARQRGVHLGRPRKLSQCQIARTRRHLKQHPNTSLAEIADTLGVSPRTLSRALNQTGS